MAVDGWGARVRPESRTMLVGLGVGPGDPELVTIRAANLLAAADVVFVPVADPTRTGRAERVVLCYAEAWRIEQVVFDGHERTGGKDRAWTWNAAVAQVAGWLTAHPGATAAYATVGDACMHSTFPRFARDVRARVPEVDVRLVPGVTPMQDLAARGGIALAEPGESLAVLSGAAGGERLRAALGTFDVVVAERMGPGLAAAMDALRATGRLADVIVGAVQDSAVPAGAGPRDAPRPDLRQEGGVDVDALPYLSTLIVPAPSRAGGAW